MHMYATLTMGGGERSHKVVERGRSRILHAYYTNKVSTRAFITSMRPKDAHSLSQNILFAFCALNELFFIALYLLSFSSPTLSPSLLEPLGDNTQRPGSPTHLSILKTFLNPYSAGALELARANKINSWWPWVFAGISFPVMAGKQIINVVQLVKASRWLAEGDRESRQKMGLPKKG